MQILEVWRLSQKKRVIKSITVALAFILMAVASVLSGSFARLVFYSHSNKLNNHENEKNVFLH
jgi:hypothetical protein